MPQILLLNHKMFAMVISTGRLVTVMKMMYLKIDIKGDVFKLIAVVKEPRKGLQMSGLFNSTGAK